MGLFRRNRPSELPEPEPVYEEKITVVILEFPPNFDSTAPEARNPKLVFQHETDSVLSGLSNCSCRMAHGRRRPECCLLCNELKEAMTRVTPDLPTMNQEGGDNSQSEEPEQSCFYSPRGGHKVAPALKFLSKIVSPTRQCNSPTRPERSSTEEFQLQLAMLTSPSLSASWRHKKTRSAGNFFFGKQLESVLNQSQSLATDELSLYHELS